MTRLDGKLLDGKPLVMMQSANSTICATLLRKRLAFVTEFTDGRWAITANRPVIIHPKFIRQVRRGQPAELLTEHKKAVAHLTETHGLVAVTDCDEDEDTKLITLEQDQLREHFAQGKGILSIGSVYDRGRETHPLLTQA